MSARSRGIAVGNAGGGARLPRTAFVLSQFPETHETFILREFEALDRMGMDFVIFSLKPCRDKVVQKGALRFLERTHYIGDASGQSAPGMHRALCRSARVLPWVRHPLVTGYVAWAARRFAALAVELGVGHIHAHWATAPTSAAALMSSVTGTPYSFTAHAWDIYAGDGKLARKAEAARFVVTCTGANVEALRRVVPRGDWGKVILNYHGIPASSRRAGSVAARAAGEPLRIVAVGRLVETKGFEYLIAALRGADFPYELTIVGDGPLRARLEDEARRARNGVVRFTGVVPNERVFEILSASHCFAMPSVVASDGDRDGIPNVMLEAMAAGLPVAASAISGIPEACIDGQTGYLVPERDAASLRAALRRIFDEPAGACEMGRRGLALAADKFSAEANAAALYGVFSRFIGRDSDEGNAGY